MMHRNKSASSHAFSMVPRADIPRATFNITRSYKTTFDAAYLVPVLCEEILPGDTFSVNLTGFARMTTPIKPVMDNLYMDTFFFFVPNRLVWENWQRFMGEQPNPGDPTSFLIPQVESGLGGFVVGSIYDYFGLPTVGQITAGQTISVNALPLRAYNLIWNEWFRDQNLQTSTTVETGDGPDLLNQYSLKKRTKRHDYFTAALPWPQKGDSVSMPLGATAPVIGNGLSPQFDAPSNVGRDLIMQSGDAKVYWNGTPSGTGGIATWGDQTGLVADLSEATAATINQLRQSFQIQKLLERDARGGTRYTEIIRAHFGVVSPDARLQRPEYLGGGSTPIIISPVAQTSATDVTGSSTALADLGAIGTALTKHHGFTQSFTEHGYIIGLINVRADITYQQGIRRMWSRETRYDFYFPAFAMLGEQAILNKEIYATGTSSDEEVFGYQERWAELRYSPSQVTGLFRSTSANTLDIWHLAQKFTSVPALNATFIADAPPIDRVVAVGEEAAGAQFYLDCFFNMRATRPMPMYSVPGLIDHF